MKRTGKTTRRQKQKKERVHGEESNYSRKRRYLDSNGGDGTQYPEPKPWK